MCVEIVIYQSGIKDIMLSFVNPLEKFQVRFHFIINLYFYTIRE